MEEETHLPEAQHILEAEFPLKPDQQPAETEIEVTGILRLCRGRKEMSEEAISKQTRLLIRATALFHT